MKYQELIEERRAEGVYMGAPKHRGIVNGPAMDAQMVASTTCDECGHDGMLYTSLTDDEGAYRSAVAHCPECESAYEF